MSFPRSRQEVMASFCQGDLGMEDLCVTDVPETPASSPQTRKRDLRWSCTSITEMNEEEAPPKKAATFSQVRQDDSMDTDSNGSVDGDLSSTGPLDRNHLQNLGDSILGDPPKRVPRGTRRRLHFVANDYHPGHGFPLNNLLWEMPEETSDGNKLEGKRRFSEDTPNCPKRKKEDCAGPSQEFLSPIRCRVDPEKTDKSEEGLYL